MPTSPGVCGSSGSTLRVSELYRRTGLWGAAGASATGGFEAPDDRDQHILTALELFLEVVCLGPVDLRLEASELRLEKLQQDALLRRRNLNRHGRHCTDHLRRADRASLSAIGLAFGRCRNVMRRSSFR